MAFKEIPLVDLGAMRSGDLAARRRKAEEVREICHAVGFMYVTNHGVPEELVQRVVRQMQDYFALPAEEKLKNDIGKLGIHRGYVPMKALVAQLGTKYDFQEGYEVGFEFPKDFPAFVAGNPVCVPNVWPERPANFARDVYDYFLATVGLGHTLFRTFALAFDLPEDWFEDKLTNPIANLRLVHYPSQSVASADYGAGVGAHTDYECFTILWQSDHGLEVRNPRGEWIAAPPVPGSFVINIGDMMQRWTNDHFVSTPHRVTNRSGRARYSMPLFFSTNYDTIVKPLDRCIAPGDKPHYRPTKVGYWVEQNHAIAYTYRWPDRGRLPDPEIGPAPEAEVTAPRAVSSR